jgi:CRP-like cAMP-binding protein/membrane protein YdbS with pleckstrin-like domain
MAGGPIEGRLSTFWLFDGFSYEELSQIAQFALERALPLGTQLYRQGDEPDFVYLVESGAIREVGQEASGRDILRRLAEAGDYFGWRSLLEDSHRNATAVVVRTARVLAFSADDFRTLLALFPHLRERILRIRTVNRLLSFPALASFSTSQLRHVAELVREVEYPAGQTVFRQGEPADAFYLIDTGQVVERATGTVPGRQTWPKYLSAGAFFGRYSLLRKLPRRATAEAVTDVRLFRLSSDAFDWLRQLQPGFEPALKRHDVLGHLGMIHTFSKLGESDLKQLAGFVGSAHLRPGDIVYRQGQDDPTLYVLYEGEAIVRGLDDEGRERPRGYLAPGDVVGETSLFLREPRDVTVEATTSSNWFYLTRDDLEYFLQQRPDLADKIIPRREVRAKQQLQRLSWMESDEQLLLRRRRHPFFLATRLLGPVILLIFALMMWLLPSLPRILSYTMLAIALLWILWRFVDWLNDYYVVTTSRVVHQEKVLLIRETREETPLDKIQNINTDTDLLGNAFGYGTLLIDTAAGIGASRVSFTYLGDPQGVKDVVFEQVRTAKAGEKDEIREAIRDRLEGTMGLGTRPMVPKPAVPMQGTVVPPPPPRPSLWHELYERTLGRWFWIERRTDDKITWRKHWVRLLQRIWAPLAAFLVWLLVLTLYITLMQDPPLWMGLVMAISFLIVLGWLWWEWENWGNDLYIVTNDRLIDVEALPLGFRLQRTETTFDRIQNVNFEIPGPIATILNYGTVAIYTAGAEGRLDFVFVRDPKRVQREVFRRLAAYFEAQRFEQRERRWADLPEWFEVYDRTYRA